MHIVGSSAFIVKLVLTCRHRHFILVAIRGCKISHPLIQKFPIVVSKLVNIRSSHILDHVPLTSSKVLKVLLSLSKRNSICAAFVIRIVELNWIVFPFSHLTNAICPGLFFQCLKPTARAGQLIILTLFLHY